MMLTRGARLSLDERMARGVAARDRAPVGLHATWSPPMDRPDPVGVVARQNVAREADLVPVRHGRMVESPFTFFRGAAAIMAADLAGTPTSGLDVQLCGDAHLSNFGVFGSPERRLVFDLNDFDETLPGPFEYDVKRLTASMTVAARNNGLDAPDVQAVTRGTVAAYREAMAGFATMRTLDVWYAHLSEDELQRAVEKLASKVAQGEGRSAKAKSAAKEAEKLRKRFEKGVRKARGRDSLQALAKLAEVVDGGVRIASDPPVVVPARDLQATYGIDPEEMGRTVTGLFAQYRHSLTEDRRTLLERFELVDWARKVVGVGSVGTRSFVVLLEGRGGDDPLFLQVKEATASVLEGPLPKSRYRQPGERVVQGQRLMQAVSDIFLGWSRGAEAGRYFYWRQLRDMKGSADVDMLHPQALRLYGGLCGWTLARAHARSGDPVAIAAYLGTDDTFDRAVTDFSTRYADQNERDHAAFTEAVRTARLEAVRGV